MSERFNILLSSAGRRVGLLDILRRALRDLPLDGEVVASDVSALSSAFHAADARVRVRSCSDDGYVGELLAVCREREIRLVVPTIDPELPVLAGARDDFAAQGCTVAVSSPEAVAIGADKHRTHDWLRAQGFPTVRQAEPATVVDDPAGWSLPLILKPRAGSASQGVRMVRDRDELARAAREPGLIAQEIAPGDEYTVDVLVNRAGHAVCAVPRRRLEVRSGEVSKGVTVREPRLEELARHVAEALPHAYGAVTVQIFLDRDERQPRVIEINPRLGGGYPLADRAGATFARWLIEELVGLPSTASADGWQSGVVMLRYDDAVFVDADAVGLTP